MKVNSISAPKKSHTMKNPLIRELTNNWELYLLILLPLTFLFLFSYLPMYGVQIAFRDYDILKGFWDSPWVGLKHFKALFESPQFGRILVNTLSLSFYNLLLFPLPIILALMLKYMPSKRFGKLVQTVSYIPHFISTVVMCGIVLQFLNERYGVINALIAALGGERENWMADPDAFPHILVWSNVWQNIGYSSITFISTLGGVSKEQHEAAIVDGANIWNRIWHVDIPGILPTASVMFVMSCGSILTSDFERILLLQNMLNADAAETISTYVYNLSLGSQYPQYSYSTAINLFTTVINIIMLLVANKVTKKMNGSAMW